MLRAIGIELTKDFREDDGKLFLSWATKKPVTRQSIARTIHRWYGRIMPNKSSKRSVN